MQRMVPFCADAELCKKSKESKKKKEKQAFEFLKEKIPLLMFSEEQLLLSLLLGLRLLGLAHTFSKLSF